MLGKKKEGREERAVGSHQKREGLRADSGVQ